MKRLLQLISWIALAATVVPSALFLAGTVQLEQVKMLMLVATVVWFVVTPLWMGRETSTWSVPAPNPGTVQEGSPQSTPTPGDWVPSLS